MKKIFLIILLVAGIGACENFDREFPDFDCVSGFFPYQFPVRTLVLGNYVYDNANDNAHKFVISVAMGGVYENKMDRKFRIEVDNSLCDNILFKSGGNAILAMPADYYKLSSNTEIVIPKGEFNGGVEVQLTDAFFNDPLAITLGYVVPIRLKSSVDVDTILSGSSSGSNSDPRIAAQWTTAPKNFTMFAVKYINEYHGTYFHYGSYKVKDAGNKVVEERKYEEQYVENNATLKLLTSGRRQVSVTVFPKSNILTASNGVKLLLDFDGNSNCTVSTPPGSSFTVSGTGKFEEGKYNWGNKERDGIALQYTISNGAHTYEASDVLVSRDRAVVMETYSPALVP